jgi:hypothetical protein
MATAVDKNGHCNKEDRQVDRVDKKHIVATDVACERIYKAYPRHVGKATALKAIAKAITDIQEQKARTSDEAADSLYSQVTKFAASPSGQRGQYTPHPATWMNVARYFDDPREWCAATHNPENKNGTALKVPVRSAMDNFPELLAQASAGVQ